MGARVHTCTRKIALLYFRTMSVIQTGVIIIANDKKAIHPVAMLLTVRCPSFVGNEDIKVYIGYILLVFQLRCFPLYQKIPVKMYNEWQHTPKPFCSFTCVE